MTGARGGARGAVGILLLVLALAAALVGAGAPERARAADTPPVQVIINAVSTPVLRKPADVLTLSVEIVNNTQRDLDAVTLKLRLSDPLTLRSELSNPTGMREVYSAAVPNVTVPAGQRVARDVRIGADKMALREANAVYAFTVDAVSGGTRAATAQILVPWVPKATPDLARTKIGVLWPLIDQPRRDGTTIGDDGQTPVFLDDGLTAELSGPGRLNALVEAGAGIPGVTWVVDPDLLSTADAMTRGYRVAPPRTTPEPVTDEAAEEEADGKKSDTETAKAAPRTEEDTEPGTGGPAAGAWLERLRGAASGDPVAALPYGDTDLAAVAHAAAGGSKTDLGWLLRDATTRGQADAAGILDQPVRADVAWPVAGALDKDILKTAQGNGATLIVAGETSLPPSPAPSYTPSTRAVGQPSLDALVTDGRIDGLLAAGASGPGQQLRLQQALVAELFTVAMEEPQRGRTLLIALPRRADADVARTVTSALGIVTAKTDGWADVARLEDVAKSPIVESRSMKPYPKDLQRTEPSDRYLRSIPELHKSVEVFAAILSKPERLTGPYNPAVLRTLSTAWRAETMDADTYRLAVSRSLRVLERLVRIAPKTGVTLSGEKGQIPITIINGLQQSINVQLGVDSRQPNRLELAPEGPKTVQPGHTTAIGVDAKSAANGKVLVDVRILTPDGEPFGPAQTFYVNTTSIDGITLGIIGVIAGLLALFSLRAYLRRRRAAGDDTHQEQPEDQHVPV